jgi:hypothetical protein
MSMDDLFARLNAHVDGAKGGKPEPFFVSVEEEAALMREWSLHIPPNVLFGPLRYRGAAILRNPLMPDLARRVGALREVGTPQELDWICEGLALLEKDFCDQNVPAAKRIRGLRWRLEGIEFYAVQDIAHG